MKNYSQLDDEGFDSRGLCDECQRTKAQGHHPSCADKPDPERDEREGLPTVNILPSGLSTTVVMTLMTAEVVEELKQLRLEVHSLKAENHDLRQLVILFRSDWHVWR